MSGGVDSSVVAAKLVSEGYDVVGVTLQLYDHGAAVYPSRAPGQAQSQPPRGRVHVPEERRRRTGLAGGCDQGEGGRVEAEAADVERVGGGAGGVRQRRSGGAEERDLACWNQQCPGVTRSSPPATRRAQSTPGQEGRARVDVSA